MESSKIEGFLQVIKQAIREELETVPKTITCDATILTEAELCTKLQVTRPTIAALRKSGKIPYFMIQKNIRYELTKVLEALNLSNIQNRKLVEE